MCSLETLARPTLVPTSNECGPNHCVVQISQMSSFLGALLLTLPLQMVVIKWISRCRAAPRWCRGARAALMRAVCSLCPPSTSFTSSRKNTYCLDPVCHAKRHASICTVDVHSFDVVVRLVVSSIVLLLELVLATLLRHAQS